MIRPLLLSFILLSTGCTEAPGLYPSLAKRPIESRVDAEPEAPAPESARPDPALDSRVKALSDQLARSDSDFTAAAATTERAAQSPGTQAVGSDSWIAAQSTLADLDTSHGETLSVLTDIERLVTDRGVAGEPPYLALDAARARAQAQLDTQTTRLAAIKARLGQK